MSLFKSLPDFSRKKKEPVSDKGDESGYNAMGIYMMCF